MGVLLRILSWAYLIGLVALVLVLRYVGEAWWPSQAAMYLPRAPFALPLVILVPGLLWLRSWRTLLGLFGGALLWLFLLMGMVVPPLSDAAPPPGGKSPVRLLSFNIWFGRRGNDAVWETIQAATPDVVAIQAAGSKTNGFLDQHFQAQGFHVHASTQFYLASRYPIQDIEVPGDLRGSAGRVIAASFVRYTLGTPLGPLDVFNVHPASPREGLDSLRGEGLLQTLQRGELPDETRQQRVLRNTETRRLQLEALRAAMGRARHPFVVAGDTNLPGLSRFLAEYLGDLDDGFRAAGQGLGYTFPAQKWVPWMRIDRILSGAPAGAARWRFLRFAVGGRGGSDHAPVHADLAP